MNMFNQSAEYPTGEFLPVQSMRLQDVGNAVVSLDTSLETTSVGVAPHELVPTTPTVIKLANHATHSAAIDEPRRQVEEAYDA